MYGGLLDYDYDPYTEYGLLGARYRPMAALTSPKPLEAGSSYPGTSELGGYQKLMGGAMKDPQWSGTALRDYLSGFGIQEKLPVTPGVIANLMKAQEEQRLKEESGFESVLSGTARKKQQVESPTSGIGSGIGRVGGTIIGSIWGAPGLGGLMGERGATDIENVITSKNKWDAILKALLLNPASDTIQMMRNPMGWIGSGSGTA